ITNGWLLYGPNPSLAAPINDQVPTGPAVGIDPRTGKLTARGQTDPRIEAIGGCERDRVMLAQLHDRDVLRRLPAQANRGNVSFYPIDPRGLPVFDSPIRNPLPLDVDLAVLRTRSDGLRALADNTDGIAAVSSNDLARSFRRIVDDLTSYYLLGYYSSGRLDGRFHTITVRVKRPGVQVRARRGYLAATVADATAAGSTGRGSPRRAPAADEGASGAALASAVAAAIAPLASYARETPMRLQIAAGWKSASAESAAIWVVGEIGGVTSVGDRWADGFDATATLMASGGVTVATGRATVPRGGRTFRVALNASQPLAPGDYL